MWDVWNVGCLGCGISGICDVKDAGCSRRYEMFWNVDVQGCKMFVLWDNQDVGWSECHRMKSVYIRSFFCSEYRRIRTKKTPYLNTFHALCGSGVFRMWDVCDVVCLECEMLGMSDVTDVECSECRMIRMWNNRNVRCGIRDVCQDLRCWFTKYPFCSYVIVSFPNLMQKLLTGGFKHTEYK